MKKEPIIEIVNGEQRLLKNENPQHAANQFKLYQDQVEEINRVIKLYNSIPALTPLKNEKDVEELLQNPRAYVYNVIKKECKVITTNKRAEPSPEALAALYDIPAKEIISRAAGAQKHLLKDCIFNTKEMRYTLSENVLKDLENANKSYYTSDETVVFMEMQQFAKELQKWAYVCGVSKSSGAIGHFFKMEATLSPDGSVLLYPNMNRFVRDSKNDPSFFQRWEETFLHSTPEEPAETETVGHE